LTSPSTSLWTPGFEVGPFEERVRSISIKIGARSLHYSPAFRLCNPLQAKNTSFTVPYHGFRYSGLLNNNIDWHIYFHGFYNKLETGFVQGVLSRHKKQGLSSICYDIGANSGYLTLVMASLAGQVITFEPSPGAYRTLLGRIADNQINHVKAFEIGCNDVDSEVDFESFHVGGISSKRIKTKIRHRRTEKFRASCKNGDKFLEEHALPSPTLLRINAGDDQLHVLEGLYSTIQKAKPVILISLSQSISRRIIDQLTLRSFLYDDVSLFSLVESEDSLSYKLDKFSDFANRIVCAPSTMDLIG